MDSLPSGKLEKDFENTFVMIRILKIPSDSDSLKELYQRIVKYNNSQNSIDEKSFVASQDIFRRLQIEFEGKGFLVCIKQSDKHQYSIKYPKISPLVSLNKSYIQKFKLDCTKLSDYVISLEKLLQIFVAFYSKPLDAIQNKSKLLKGDSQQNKKVVEFIKNPQITSKDMVNLLLLYWRAEKEKNCSPNGKEPNSFYLIHWFAKYDCKDKAESISEKLSSEADVQSIIKKYKIMFKRYYNEWTKANEGKDYNTMIKSPINLDLENEAKNYAEDVIAELES